MPAGMEAIRERLTRLEELIGPISEDEEQRSINDRLGEAIESAERTESLYISLAAETSERLEAAEEAIAILKKAVANTSVGTCMSKPKIPEPKAFGGARSSKELENFLWDMEHYFSAAKVRLDEQVNIAVMYLTGDAKLWWRTRSKEDLNAGRPKVETWETLKRELKEQFLPNNTSWIAREDLKKLRQDGSVRDYVKKFSSLILDIDNMSEEDRMFNFLSGLQPWAQLELRRQKVSDLSSAISAADGLADFGAGASKGNAGASSDSYPMMDRYEMKKKKKGLGGGEPKQADGNGKSEAKGKEKVSKSSSGCFICEGKHVARDCLLRAQLSVISVEKDGEGTAYVNPIHVLNTK
jgi:hypothetical protein